MDRAECGFCGESRASSDMVRGGNAFICGPCLGAGLNWSISSRGGDLAREIPEADRPCSFCEQRSPSSAKYTHDRGTDICTSCLSRGFWFFAQAGELEARRQTWRFLEDKSPHALLQAHFPGTGLDEIVTSSRRFPEYMRVDLNKALQVLLPAGSRCIGLHQQYAHETLDFSTVVSREGRVAVAPIQYDEVDTGDERPARCLRKALWLVEHDSTPHAVLVTPSQSFGRATGWHVEVAVAPGERGDGIVNGYFKAIEEALAGAVSYRGKVLSLEASDRVDGTGALVTVHRVASVPREDVILPASTLALLERNVFRFAAQRKALAAMGLPVKKGLLFYGPPGTGKTHTIRYLAAALPDHTTLLVTAEQVALIEHYMILARLLSPSILVIEDADLIARQREDMSSPCEEVLLNRLLNEMDGLKENAEIVFVLTTNRPESLELALRARPGRIDQAIEFPLPDADGRRKLARLYGRGAPLAQETIEHVVARTDRVSAAFMKELMRRATQYSLDRGSQAAVTSRDVDAALDEMLFTGGRLNAALLGASDVSPAPGAL